MTNMNAQIVSLNETEIDEVDGGALTTAAAIVGIAAGLIYIGGELHDAFCRDH